VVPVVAAMLGVAALAGPRPIGTGLLESMTTLTGAGGPALPPASEREYPTPGVEEADSRLSDPVQGNGSTAFTFQEHQSMPITGPVTWSPCRPIHFVVDASGAPPDFAEHVRSVAREVATATGLVLVDDGATTEAAGDQRASFQPDRYGDRWAPVLVRVADAVTVPSLDGDVAGAALAASATDLRTGVRHYVSGEVLLDAEVLANPPTPAGDPDYLAVLRHELGHLMGLGHVDDPSQLMHPVRQASAEGTYQAGDLAGLAALGQGRCAPGL
jgi:hypothetical protein